MSIIPSCFAFTLWNIKENASPRVFSSGFLFLAHKDILMELVRQNLNTQRYKGVMIIECKSVKGIDTEEDRELFGF